MESVDFLQCACVSILRAEKENGYTDVASILGPAFAFIIDLLLRHYLIDRYEGLCYAMLVILSIIKRMIIELVFTGMFEERSLVFEKVWQEKAMRIFKKNSFWIGLLVICLCLLSACQSAITPSNVTGSSGSTRVVNVVAAENFYGDIVRQVGGSHVSVTSILSDPNTDPHEFTASTKTLQEIIAAKLVIKNGLDYDNWMDQLLSNASNSNQIVLTSGTIVPHKLPDNPHVWYSFDNAQAMAQAIAHSLEQIDAADKSTFEANLATFDASLTSLRQKTSEIKKTYVGTPVALTETIYLYQTELTGLNVLTPFEFMKAIAEGNDPPANTVLDIQNELAHKQAKIVIYNEQTITPVTTNIQKEAQTQHIPLVPVWETMPPGKTYQTWMMGQLMQLESALQQGTGK